MWRELQRFSALGRTERGLFFRAAVLLPFISLSLRWRGFGRTKAALQKRLSSSHQSTQKQTPDGLNAFAVSAARMVQAAARRTLGGATCLEQSLALWWLLGRRGIASELRVGVRKDGEKFEAHAWVECCGVALTGAEGAHAHYAAFDSALASLPPVAR